MPHCLGNVSISLCSWTSRRERNFSSPAGETREVFLTFLKRSQVIPLLTLLQLVGSSLCLSCICFWPSVGPSDTAKTKTRKLNKQTDAKENKRKTLIISRYDHPDGSMTLSLFGDVVWKTNPVLPNYGHLLSYYTPSKCQAPPVLFSRVPFLPLFPPWWPKGQAVWAQG